MKSCFEQSIMQARELELGSSAYPVTFDWRLDESTSLLADIVKDLYSPRTSHCPTKQGGNRSVLGARMVV